MSGPRPAAPTAGSRPRPRRSLAAALIAAALLAACGSTAPKHRGSAPTSPPTTTPPAATTGYSPGAGLPLAVGPAPASWNCDAAGADTGSCLAVVDAVWPSVFQEDASGQPQLDTAFVTSATVTSISPQTVVYRINPKATWSDGVPITWQDFAYAWQAQSGSAAYRDAGGAPFTPASTDGYSDIASVTGAATDPDTVTVTFAHPDPDWMALFGAGHPLLPAHVAQRVGFDGGFTDPVDDLVSGGPFLVQAYQPGQSVTLVRNPRYWGTAAALASVTVRFTASPAQLAPALQRSIVKVAEVTWDPGSLASADAYSTLKRLDDVTVKAVPSATYETLELDEATPALADPVLRRALLAAVPRAALLKLVPGASDASVDPLGDRFALPGSDGYTDDTPSGAGAGDPVAARRLLQAGGYDATPDAPLTKGGQAVALRLTAEAGQPVLQAQEQAIIAALEEIGITVTESDSEDVAGTLAGTGWDLALTTANASPFPGSVAASYVAGDAGDVEHVSDPQVTQLLGQAATTLDAGKRAGLLHQADTMLWADAVDLPLFQLPAVLATRSGVGGAAPAVGAEGPTSTLSTWGVTGSS